MIPLPSGRSRGYVRARNARKLQGNPLSQQGKAGKRVKGSLKSGGTSGNALATTVPHWCSYWSQAATEAGLLDGNACESTNGRRWYIPPVHAAAQFSSIQFIILRQSTTHTTQSLPFGKPQDITCCSPQAHNPLSRTHTPLPTRAHIGLNLFLLA